MAGGRRHHRGRRHDPRDHPRQPDRRGDPGAPAGAAGGADRTRLTSCVDISLRETPFISITYGPLRSVSISEGDTENAFPKRRGQCGIRNGLLQSPWRREWRSRARPRRPPRTGVTRVTNTIGSDSLTVRHRTGSRPAGRGLTGTAIAGTIARDRAELDRHEAELRAQSRDSRYDRGYDSRVSATATP